MVDIDRAVPNFLGIRVEKSITAANGEVSMFNITGGLAMVTSLVGRVTTAIGSTVATLKVDLNPTATGATERLCATINVETDIVGTLYSLRLGLSSQALIVGTTGAVVGITGTAYIFTGALVSTFSADPVGGVIRWVLHYHAIDSDAAVVAA